MIKSPLHPSWHLYLAFLGIIISVVVSFITDFILCTSPFWLAPVLMLFVLAIFKPTFATLPFALAAGLILGNLRASPILISRATFRNLSGQTITITGTISEDPDSSSGVTVLRLKNLQIETPPTTNPNENPNITPNTQYSGILYVKLANKNPDLARSDEITLKGKLRDGFGTFVGFLSRPELTHWARDVPGDLPARLKRQFSAAVGDFVPEPASGLGLGYLMGAKTGISQDFSEALRAVGMTHVVVASGAHLGVLVGLIKKLFRKISKFASLLFSLLAILAFALIVGFTSSMTRAALVAGLSLCFGYIGRSFSPWRLILFVATLTLLITPENFLHLGWQLSFASFIGLLILAPALTKFLYGGKKPPWLASMLITSLATCLTCAPILIYNFGSLSLLSFIANLIILPTLPYAMLLIFLTGIASPLPILPNLFAKLATLLLNFHIWLVNSLSEKTAFILEFPSENPLFFLLYLPISAVLCYNIWHEIRPKTRPPD